MFLVFLVSRAGCNCVRHKDGNILQVLTVPRSCLYSPDVEEVLATKNASGSAAYIISHTPVTLALLSFRNSLLRSREY
jgi:hypothetical protein